MTRPERANLTEPLESVTAFFGLLLLLLALAGVGLVLFQPHSGSGSGSFSLCVSPGISTGSGNPPIGGGFTARPGATLMVSGSLQGCLTHPGVGQWLLYCLMLIPSVVVWAGVIVLLWLLMRTARREGPFTPSVATAMRRLGWFILGGSVTAGVLHTIALGQLTAAMMSSTGFNLPSLYVGPIWGAVRGVAPVPLLAGAALLTLARIIRLGSAMDDEIKATV
jgi:hypothetical protein